MPNPDDGHDEIIDRTSLPPTHDLLEQQMNLIVEGLQIEYSERANKVVHICSDSRFIAAKRNLYEIAGKKRAEEILHRIFNF